MAQGLIGLRAGGGIMQLSIAALAEAIGARVVCGDPAVVLSGVAEFDAATPGDLVFVEQEKDLPRALASAAGAVVAGEFASGPCGAGASPVNKAVLVCAHPKLAFVRAAARLCPPPRRAPGVQRTAVVHESAVLGRDVAIAERVTVEASVRIGDRTQVAPGVVIGEGCTLGEDCDIKPNVVIYPGTKIGNRVIVHAGAVLGADGFGFVPDPATGAYEKFPQVGWLEIGDDVEIGANVTIDRGALGRTVIGAGTKFDDQVHIGHNVLVGRNVVMPAQCGIGGSSVIDDSVMMGGQVGVGDHVHIGEGVILGAQCGVPTHKVLRGKGVIFWGTPARPIKDFLKELAVLASLARKRGRE